MATVTEGSTIRASNPTGGAPYFSIKAVVTTSATSLPAELSATDPVTVQAVANGVEAVPDVHLLQDEVTAATYQTANPTLSVGYPVAH